MKKIFVALLFILTIQFSFAQNFKYGISGGVHKTSIVGIHDYSKGKFGGNVGFFANFTLVENDVWDSAWLYLEPRIEYSMQGENAEPPQGYQKFHNDYVAMALQLKYFFHKGNLKRDVFLFAGPRIEYLVREHRDGPPNYDMFEGMEDNITKFNYGVTFGTGLKISQQLEATLRYDWGFKEIYPDYTHKHTFNRLLSLGINFYLSPNW